MNALIYIAFSSSDEMRKKLKQQKNKIFAYCEQKKYEPLIVFEVVESTCIQKRIGLSKIIQLVNRKLIDVIVISDQTMHKFNNSKENYLVKALKQYSVNIDCIC